jgi:FkbM family methyltransferase
MPPFKGKQRVARFLLKSVINDHSDILVSGKFDCIYKLPNIKENIGFEIYINGVYEYDTIRFIAERVKKGATLLDIGANIGAIAVPLCKQRRDIKVLCLEASSWLFQYLKHNIEINGVNTVDLLNKAIWSEEDKEIEFFSPRDKYGKGSLASLFTSESERIRTITLDQIASMYPKGAIDFIKIDVEGFEYYAFSGGKDLLQGNNAPSILFEFVDWAENAATSNKAGIAQSLLLEYGYQLYPFKNSRLGEKLTSPLSSGASLIYATKKPIT